jgi:hypothetical protein
MARGFFQSTTTISTNTDTAVIAAPGAGEQIYLHYISVSVSVAGTSSRLVAEKGANGTALFRMATATADGFADANYSTGRKNFPGLALGVNTALNIETSGTAAATVEVTVIYEVK